ncbi:MAG TPA: large conductance mechanosensitive channel protein MscL, partial [Allosphingosinicella sp.]|nr:large conductance mechanosensitive channel protein MscL [Allosphingosinicella sp.]
MMSGFREFITRGNVVDLAVAVIIGVAFTAIITSLTDDIIMPVVGYLFGGLDFSSYFLLLGEVPDGIDPYNYEALKEAGVPMVGYGQFITAAVNFLIIAFIIYLIVKMLKKAARERAAEPAADAAEIVL